MISASGQPTGGEPPPVVENTRITSTLDSLPWSWYLLPCRRMSHPLTPRRNWSGYLPSEEVGIPSWYGYPLSGGRDSLSWSAYPSFEEVGTSNWTEYISSKEVDFLIWSAYPSFWLSGHFILAYKSASWRLWIVQAVQISTFWRRSTKAGQNVHTLKKWALKAVWVYIFYRSVHFEPSRRSRCPLSCPSSEKVDTPC